MSYSYSNRRGDTYYLHTQVVQLQNGRKQQIYFFAREAREGKSVDALPHGYEVSENEGSGLPVLRKRRAQG